MKINVTFGNDLSTLPVGYVESVLSAVRFIQDEFADPGTLNLTVTQQSGTRMDANFSLNAYSYATVKAALIAHASTSDDKLAATYFPSTSPAGSGSNNIFLTDMQAQALGLASGVTGGGITVGDKIPFDYNPADGITGGQYDFVGMFIRTLTRELGRTSLAQAFGGDELSLTDLFRYSGTSVRNLTAAGGYLSIDGGQTNLDSIASGIGAFDIDWAATAGADSFLATYAPGQLTHVSATDFRVMDVIGFTPIEGRVAVGGTFAGKVDVPGDHDFLGVQLTKGVSYIITEKGVAGGVGTLSDPSLKITDLAGTVVASNDDSGSLDSQVTFTPTTTGTYYINAGAFAATSSYVGTYEVSVSLASQPTGVASFPGTIGDFNGDGRDDLLWRHIGDGATVMWLQNGLNPSGGGATVWQHDTDWSIVGVQDFNGDGRDDVLWRNAQTGVTEIWHQNGLSPVSGGTTSWQHDTSWMVVGTGDFDGDGKGDILWRGDDGQTEIWRQDGLTTVSATTTIWQHGIDWAVAGIGDFNGDGRDDVLWRHPSDGHTEMWFLNGAAPVGGGATVWQHDNTWTVQGVADFNGDNRDDILWRKTTGATEIWLENGLNPVGGGATAWQHDTAWAVQGVGDFNGDSKGDVLWRRASDGLTELWEQNGLSPVAGGATGWQHGTDWAI